MNRITLFVSMCLVMIAAGVTARADTEFTYQGELMNNGSPSNGAFDLDFTLWNAATAGVPIGSAVSLIGVDVVDGRFTVELDFGADAFDNSGRWLEVAVEGVTLSPRHSITRSPYSIQTRGIFVDENQNVGIGTTSPQHLLHVVGDTNAANAIYGFSTELSNAAAGVYGQSASSGGYGVYGYASALNGSNYGVFGKTDGSFGYGVFAHATHPLGQTYGVYSESRSNAGIGVYGEASSNTGNTYGVWGKTRSPNGFAGYFEGQGYFSGNVGFGTMNPAATIDVVGDSNFRNRLGIGDPSALFGQLSIVDSGDGSIFAIEANSDNFAFPTIFASNPSGPSLWAQGASDASPSTGGIIVVGDQAGRNIAIDDNEIMARDNGQTADLHLNADGGNIKMGPQQSHPAHAYAKINGIPGIVHIVSATPNVLSVNRLSDGVYSVEIDGGIAPEDVVIVSSNRAGVVGEAGIQSIGGGQLECFCCEFYDVDSGDPRNCTFSLLIFRP